MVCLSVIVKRRNCGNPGPIWAIAPMGRVGVGDDLVCKTHVIRHAINTVSGECRMFCNESIGIYRQANWRTI